MPPKTNKQREKLEQSQASSRAKAHESLRATGGFVGFSSFAKPTTDGAAPVNPFTAFASGSTVATTTGDDYSGGSGTASAIYDGSDHEIAMALKMLGKKGTVTKVKALQGFLTDILPHKKPVELRGMVGHFVQLYTFEVRDQKDRKVRQLLNDVLLGLTTKLKPKAFAAHLRRLLPYWLMAMHDPNPEAAVAATKALEALFPDNREMQAEVVVAHLSAIMEEYSTFFQHTPDTFPGVTLAESDEREERYERCVTAAVLSVDKIITLLTSTGNLDKLSDTEQAFSVASVVSADKFGRLVSATSKNINFTRDGIRKATYKTLKSLVTSAFEIVEVREEYFGKLILGALSDKHPANQHDLWDMVLTFLQKAASTLWRPSESQSFSKFVKSAVQPRLFAQVRHGFFGSARSSFPVLLPLLSMIPLEHVVDVKSGTCALYSGVLENAWKFLVSTEGRFYEEITIQSAFECLRAFVDFFLRSPTNRDAAMQLFEVTADNDSVPSERIVSAYIHQFEKSMKDSLVAVFTSTKLSVRNIKTYANEWKTMTTKLNTATDVVSGVVAKQFVASCNTWLVAVLETLPSTVSVQPNHVTTFLKIIGDVESEDARTFLVSAGKCMYRSCIEQLTNPDRATLALELMNGLYDVIGPDTLGVGSADESVEQHFEHHVRPLVIATGATTAEQLGSNDVAVILRAARHFFVLVEDKKAFVLQLFQDFGVQYGDLFKGARIVDTCFRYPFTSTGAAQWVTSGSFSDLKDNQLKAGDEHALTAVWKGKLLDEFVMISLKGRLDDANADAFSTVLQSCVGGDESMPVVSADAVVILSHFVTQQNNDDDVVMRILPSLVALFTKLSDVALPSELQSAEEQLYQCLLHLAAKSNSKTEAATLWKRHLRSAVFKWTSERRLALINSLATTINDLFASEGAAYSSKIWASYVELYAELACTEDEDAACTPFALINRLTIFDLRFEGSRAQLTTLYDRLLSCLAELCDAEDANDTLTKYFTELLERDTDRGLKLLRRIADIDICHGLTWAILQSDSMASLSQDSTVLPFEYVSLRSLYTSLADHLPNVIAVVSDDTNPRSRRVLFTNQHTEAAATDDIDSLEDLTTEQHARLDRHIINILVSFLTPTAAAIYAEAWIEKPSSSTVLIDRIVRILSGAQDPSASEVLERVVATSIAVLPQWPGAAGVDALKVISTVWTMKRTTCDFDAAVHHPLLLKLSRAFAMSSQTSVQEWIDVAAYLTSSPSAWVDSETLEDSKKRWSLAARGLLIHALAGNQQTAAVAALGIHKRTLPPSFEDTEGEARTIIEYPLALVRCRRVVAELVHAMALVDNGEALRELPPNHLEEVLSTLLCGVAEGLLLKSQVVPTYLELFSASQSLAIINLGAEVDALLDAATLTLPTLLPLISDTNRVRVLLLDAFVHIKGLAACFNRDKSTTPLHVRALLYTICTTTGVFKPSENAASAGVDINADDEAAAEAALAKSLIPAGLRAALKAAFQVASASPARTKRSRRKQHARPEEEDEFVGQLLVWDLFIQLFPDSGSRDGGHLGMRSSALCAYVAKNGLLSTYLNVCGELLSRETGAQSTLARLKLQDEPLYTLETLDDAVGEVTTVSLAAQSFFRTVLRLPAMVRTWWNDECSRSLRSWATKYFEEHITPYVLASELEIIAKASESQSWDTEEMTVKGSKVSREITTTYLKDECALEMVIRVPSAYPLRSVEVECTRRIGITEDRWRRWVLQIIKVTSAQDGSLLDAVLLWKQNLDKEFEGVEPCPICYSILNPKTMGLPTLSCKTCSNKYHNSCLYKWFNQSGKNKCPICQQPFT